MLALVTELPLPRDATITMYAGILTLSGIMFLKEK